MSERLGSVATAEFINSDKGVSEMRIKDFFATILGDAQRLKIQLFEPGGQVLNF
jgi:hypothetical protein